MLKKILLLFIIQILFTFYCKNKIIEKSVISQGIFPKPVTLDPSEIDNKVSNNIIPQIFESLITIEDKDYLILPKLSKSWKNTKNGLSYYFYLRPNIKFHNGSYLTAYDVKLSFIRQFDNKCSYYYDNPPKIFKNVLEEIIDSIDIVDSLTVKFNLKYSNSLFLYLLSSPLISPIISSKELKEHGKNLGKYPIGTGPFMLQNTINENEIVLIPFKEYWDKIPNIKELKFEIGIADDLEIKALKDSIDVLSRISGNNIDKFRNSNKFNFFSTRLQSIYFLGFNLEKDFIKSKNFRRSILFCINKSKIVNTLNRTNAIIADGPLPNGIFDLENLNKQENYSLKKAKIFLNKLGNNIPRLKLIGFVYSLRSHIFFDIVVDYLNSIGIEIEKRYYNDWEEFENAKRHGDYDLILDGWTDNILGDPYFFLYNLFYSNSNFNVFHYKSEKVDRLLDEAVRTFDKDKRYRIYKEINNIIIEDIPAVFISQIKDVFVVNKRIKNVIINPYRYIEYKDVIIE